MTGRRVHGNLGGLVGVQQPAGPLTGPQLIVNAAKLPRTAARQG